MNLGSCIFVMLVLSFFKTIFCWVVRTPVSGGSNNPHLYFMYALGFIFCNVCCILCMLLVFGFSGSGSGGGVKRIFKIMAHFLLG